MFPNDNICNINVAKSAAKRIFQRYTTFQSSQPSSQNKQSNKPSNLLLGEKQVSILMKNAYSAININFDPSSQDIFSFMQVFGIDQNNKISLNKMQEFAIKYLCGNDNNPMINENDHHYSHLKQQKDKQNLIKIINPQLINNFNEKTIKAQTKNNSGENIINQKHKFNVKNLELQHENKTTDNLLYNKNIYFNYNQKNKRHMYLSPKARVEQTYNFPISPDQYSHHQHHTQFPFNPILSLDTMLQSAHTIFNRHLISSFNQGITLLSAKSLLTESYKLIGRQQYNPSDEDIKIWMKLCDANRTGIVRWESYEHFMKRLFERQVNNINRMSYINSMNNMNSNLQRINKVENQIKQY